MVSQWAKKASGREDSVAPPGDLAESNEQAQSRSSDPAVVGLCRGMVGLSLALLVGLMTLAWVLLRSDIDWDASVVKVDRREVLVEAPDEPASNESSATTSGVIRFDLSRLNSDGLLGPPDGLRALSYEFCIPAGEAYVTQVEAIDSTAAIHRSSPGRIGCGEAEYLAIGHTHQPDFRQVLVRLSRLPYVDRIEQAHFE
ncbi:MAG: hypothetical protein WBP34_13550 [Thermoanaerobaculia bacterium]